MSMHDSTLSGRERIIRVHENSDFKVFLHSCGSIHELIPIVIDCGIDILRGLTAIWKQTPGYVFKQVHTPWATFRRKASSPSWTRPMRRASY